MLEAAPAKLQQYNAELDRLRKPADSDKLAKQLDQLPINQLDKRLTSAMGELQQAQEELAAASSQLTTLQTLPERVQVSMSQAFNRSQDIRNQLNGVNMGRTHE